MCYFGVLGNKAFNNVLAISSLNQVERWVQRWYGQAGLMDQAVSHLWSGVHIICENGWAAEFVQDISTDILS